ncbi:MAG: sialidase family protein [Verrucomicrobiota bacterium]
MNPYHFLPIKIAFAALTLTLAARAAVEPPQFAEVFTAGKDSFASIRIPSVVVTRAGTVLAFAEGRAVAADQANNKLILKRSADGGRTWGPLQIIAADGKNCLNNPCAVVVGQTGRIILMFQSYPFGFSERDGKIQTGLDGPAIVRNYVIHSDDDGRTWSPMADVTRTTKRAEGVTILASGPGIGLQLQHGPHAGRILMPFNEGPFGRWHVLSVFSDDGGDHWQLGESAPGCCVTNSSGRIISLVNEVQMVELADGGVMLNSRKWGGQPLRKVAVSRDGGVTWSPITEAAALHDPGCMASILRFTFATAGGRSRILYSGPDSTRREQGTVYLSYDEGGTWPVKKVLWPGSFAYSVLTRLPDGSIGCLCETESANRMVFARFTLEWLTDGLDSISPNSASPAGSPEMAGPRQADIFTGGTDGYHTYRIPAAVLTTAGTLLAFCEGRKSGGGDSGDIDLVLKRGPDGGRVWEPLQPVRVGAGNTCGNPCPVVDRATGIIWLLHTWNRGDDHERQIIDQTSRDTRRIFVSSSRDDGRTWSDPREITAAVKRTNWTWYATGPGAGIQLERGNHTGRLVIPCDHIEAGTRKYFSHVIYSDDHGQTWQLGGSSPLDQVNECEVVELSDGKLLLNMRNYDSGSRTRQVCWSDDGGAHWPAQRHDPALIEPICQASIRRLRWPTADQAGAILFANPASARQREKMTVRLSRDDGQTWPWAREIYAGAAAYSCLVNLPGNDIGCFYEADGYRRIALARFSLDWLMAGPTSPAGAK